MISFNLFSVALGCVMTVNNRFASTLSSLIVRLNVLGGFLRFNINYRGLLSKMGVRVTLSVYYWVELSN